MSGQPSTDDGFDDIVEMVDQPSYDAPPRLRHKVLTEQRLPILAPWAKDIDEFKRTARWQYDHYRHTWAYHLIRTPLYAARAALRVPRGLGRLAIAAAVWCRDPEGAAVLGQVVEVKEPERYAKLAELHADRVRRRSIAVVAAVAAAVLAPFALVGADAEVQATAVVAAIAGLSKLGEERDKPLVSRAVVTAKAERLTADVVEQALRSLTIAAMKNGDITFPAPITRDGPGWRADIDLPHGVTVADVAEKRDAIASGLRRATGAVWVEASPGQHAGRMILWVGDEAVSDRRPDPWPLTKKGTVDLFQPFPFGTDPRGRPVTIELSETNVLIGAMPGAGKTFALRLLVLAAALDVRSELHVFELKGTGDLEAVEQVAHRYGSGPDEQTIEACMASLQYVHAELERRAEAIKGLPRDARPENKVTSDLASLRRQRLHPLVLTIDEAQELFTHPQYGGKDGEAARLCTAIIKRGRALGVILLLATQRPDANSLPTGISGNVGIRYCLRVMGRPENDMVLGEGMRRNGYDATMFTKRDKGLGWLVGAHEDPVITRTAYVDGPAAERIAGRAHAARVAAGTLTGQAAGETADDVDHPTQLLTDILTVVPAHEDKVWSSDVVERLQARAPNRYHAWDQSQLAFALKPYDVATKPISRRDGDEVTSRRGIHRDDVFDALQKRQDRDAV